MAILNGSKKRKRYQENGKNEKQLLSYWTSAETVECENGTILNKKLQGKQDDIDSRAIIDHAANNKKYGVGTSGKYGHVMAFSIAPKPPGSAYAGDDNGKYAREGHVHPVQTTISGNAATATKLQTARTINGTAFNGESNINIRLNPSDINTSSSHNFIAEWERDRWHGYGNEIDKKAIINHASQSKDYGIGTASNFGHVKLSSIYSKIVENDEGICASHRGLCNAYTELNATKLSIDKSNFQSINPGATPIRLTVGCMQYSYMNCVYGNHLLQAELKSGSSLTLATFPTTIRPMNTIRTIGYSGDNIYIVSISTDGKLEVKNTGPGTMAKGRYVHFTFNYFKL